MMLHAVCLAVLLAALAILDVRAHRRTVAILAAIGSHRAVSPVAEVEAEDDDGANDDEGGALAVVEFDGPEPGDPPILVPVRLDDEELARVDEVVDAVRETGDRPSGERAAFVPPEPDDPA